MKHLSQIQSEFLKNAVDFHSQEQEQKYLQKHPNANPNNLKIINTQNITPTQKKSLLHKIKDKTIELLDKATRPTPEEVEAVGGNAEDTKKYYEKVDKGEAPRKFFVG